MRLLNLDLDVLLFLESKGNKYSSEIVMGLGDKISDKLDNTIIIDSCIKDDISGGNSDGYGVTGVYTPLITKDGVDYTESNILFTAMYILTKDSELRVYGETVLRGKSDLLSKIKIIAGGITKDLNGDKSLNLVLKVPKGCYYGLSHEGIMYDEFDKMLLDTDALCEVTLADIVKNCNILPPRGVYNKTLYRHYEGNWYLVEGVGSYVDHNVTLVAYREMYGALKLHFTDKVKFTSENDKKDEYPLQDYRFMTIEELEYSLGEDSKEYRNILSEYNKLINEHSFIIGL